MKKHALMAVLFVLALPTAYGQSATTTTQEPMQSKNPWLRLANNGAWWNALSPDSKSDLVDGFVTAMADVHKMLIGFVKQNSRELTPGDPKSKFDAQVSAIIQLAVIAERYEYEEVGRAKLLSGIDEFYKEPLNKLIPIEFAFPWERDTLNGKVAPKDLQKQLNDWRATMNK